MVNRRTIRPNPSNLAARDAWFAGVGGVGKFYKKLRSLPRAVVGKNFLDVLLAILDRVRGSGEGGSFPGFARISEDSGVSRSTVQRALRFWQANGVLSWTPGDPTHANRYSLLKSPLSVFKASESDLSGGVNLTLGGRVKLTLGVGSSWTSKEDKRYKGEKVKDGETSSHSGGEPFTRGTDQGRSEGVSRFDKNKLVVSATAHQMPSGGLGIDRTAPTTSQAETTRQDRQSGGLALVVGSDLKASGSNEEDDMSWRTGGYNMSGKAVTDPRTGEDAMSKAERAPSKRPTDAFRVWGHMQVRAKDKMSMDLPGMMGWEAKMLQKLVDTDGYGVDAVMAMVDTLTDNWTAIRENLRLKEDAPTVKTLVFKAAELKGSKGRMLGKGANWASPDIEEAAKAAVAAQRAERLAAKAKLAGGVV